MSPTPARILATTEPARGRRYRIEVAISTTAPDLARTLGEIQVEPDRAIRDELLGWLLIWIGQRHLSDAAITRRERKISKARRERAAATRAANKART